MAHHEGDFRGSVDEPLSLNQLLALLASLQESDVALRNDAIACALSASEGWQEAVKRLGGAFAGEAPGLKERNDGLPWD